MALPDSSPDSKTKRLPFEPASSRKKDEKKPAFANSGTQRSDAKKTTGKSSLRAAENAGIPEVVSRRMAKRMALFCGVPSLMGMLSFVGSYVVIRNHWMELPPVVTLIVSLSCFGLGFVGLSYGVISASWEEDQDGSFWGMSEFKSNWSKITAARKESKESDS